MSGIEKKSQSPIVTEIAIDNSEKKLAKSKLKRWLFALGGTVSLTLAILGVFVPGLPCTPFALLAAALFAKSSDRLYLWLLNSKLLGARIKNYQKRKGISKKEKTKILLLMWAMVLISSLIIVKPLTLKLIIIGSGIVGSAVVWFIVPEGKENANEN